jgi:L-ascorbate metabolism protein UlaG (beta-lactamase superfamily)
MITPAQKGKALLNDIATTQPQPGEVAIWWLGQSGYAIKTASTEFYIDLYLSEHLTNKYKATEKPHIRMVEAPLRGADLARARWVFATHKHSDHLDPGTLPDLFQAAPEAKLVLPLALVNHAVELGLDRERLIPTQGNETLELDGLTVHSIPSAHPGLDYDDQTGYPFLGFLFEADGVKLYHSGDTIEYDGLVDRLHDFAPDIVFLPINGTDERRKALGVAPNFSESEAVDIAQRVEAKLLIPHHYDMFTFNTADQNRFRQYVTAANQPFKQLEVGERFIWEPEVLWESEDDSIPQGDVESTP